MDAKIWNKNKWITITDPVKLKDIFKNILFKSGFKVEGFIEKYFNPFGYTAIWLLSESHLAIHTFPEENKTYIEISSCNYKMYKAFISNLKII